MNEGIHIIFFIFLAPFIAAFFIFVLVSIILLICNRKKIRQKFQENLTQTCTNESSPFLRITEVSIMGIILTKQITSHAITILSYTQYSCTPLNNFAGLLEKYNWHIWCILFLADLIMLTVCKKNYKNFNIAALILLFILFKPAYLIYRANMVADKKVVKRAFIFTSIHIGIPIALIILGLLTYTVYVISLFFRY